VSQPNAGSSPVTSSHGFTPTGLFAPAPAQHER
jgi:hypothetical protein